MMSNLARLLPGLAMATTVIRQSAAAAIAMGSAFNDIGLVPTVRRGKHRTSADTKAGRQMVSRKYRSSNAFAHLRNSGGGERECARRQRQIQAGKLWPVWTPVRPRMMPTPEVYARPRTSFWPAT
jgi:hypothetical protein